MITDDDTITIDRKETRLFIAIAKQEDHSFLMLGIYDEKNNSVEQLLCRVGKSFIKDLNSGIIPYIKNLFLGLFSSIESDLYKESLSRKHLGGKPISYQAYDITYEQYLQFLQILESFQKEGNSIHCYKPKQVCLNKVILELTDDIVCPKKNYDHLKMHYNNIHNTCRHTSIKILDTVKVDTANVSSYFFKELSCKTQLDYGVPSSEIPFYVLPHPPAVYPNLKSAQKKILETLYKRMEQMIGIESTAKLTQAKFVKLKELYKEILGPQKEASLEQLLQGIQTWKNTNHTTLTALRRTYFWDVFIGRKSSTEKMIGTIEHDLQTSICLSR